MMELAKRILMNVQYKEQSVLIISHICVKMECVPKIKINVYKT